MVRKTADKLAIVNTYLAKSSSPIKLVPLANELGIRVYNAAWPDNISGKIQKDAKRGGKSGFAIFVNQDHPKTRQRFTIAHEIAHYVLHESKIGDGVFDDAMYRSGLSNSAEVQANALAADILMPWRLLRPLINQHGDNVELLAEKFGVSRSAMAIRLDVPY